ncbi:hypothetical protein J7T55_001548 [Diaporthe amygdali]|uniref:uncharacterized protein n=1 Tax=Phomopsis amygdali TaxID=1214568 RepID=UPI0022FE3BE0|nr:uncharacterized protein J7T55_001548 [Diaporthe amygdali]KAJ0115139.1 hypothetical protein J7T55_001548 [Diaporthe amygdali]
MFHMGKCMKPHRSFAVVCYDFREFGGLISVAYVTVSSFSDIIDVFFCNIALADADMHVKFLYPLVAHFVNATDYTEAHSLLALLSSCNRKFLSEPPTRHRGNSSGLTARMPQAAEMSLYGPEMVETSISLNGLYEYEPLPSKTHTRLLILSHGTGEDILIGNIKTVDLDASDLDSFEAISYVWGSDEKEQSILIDGRPLPITNSLREALLQTRLPEKPRTLWADSICINQDDTIEKGHQVFAMGRIYKASRRTLICLGLEPHHAEKAREAAALINEVAAMIEDILRDLAFTDEYDTFPWPSEDDPLVVDTRWLSAREFLVRHLWFEPPSRRSELEPLTDIRALHSNNFNLRRREEARAFVDQSLESNNQASTTLSLLQNARRMKLTDPRDRIYAFMALETRDGVMAGLNLQPDYARPHQEVFYEFAVRYLERTSDLKILTHVDHEEEGLNRLSGVPSWVPQWDNGANAAPLHSHDFCEPFFFSNQQPGITNIIDGSELRLRGVLVGPVRYASRRIVKNLDDPTAEVLTLWWEVMAEMIKGSGPLKEHLALAFIDAICVGRFRGEEAAWKEAEKGLARYLELNKDADQLQKSLQDPRIYQDAHRVLLLAIDRSDNRRVVVLQQGFIGVTSAAARQGDLCAFISGLCCPLILRPVSGKADHYMLVGNAYVVRGTFVADGEVSTLRLHEDHEDWIEEYLPAQNIILV